MAVIEDVTKAEGGGSRKAKRAFIEDWFDDPADSRPKEDRELWKIIHYAYNPWFNYYTTTIPGLNELATDARRKSQQTKMGHKKIFDDGPKTLGWKDQFRTMFELLDDMKSRKLPPNSTQTRATILDWAKKCGSGTIEIFRRILHKDLKVAMKANSFNAIYKGWVPEFKIQLAQPFDEKKLKFPCFVDPKFDGERCLAFIVVDGPDTSVTYFSRNGNQFFNYGCFDSELKTLFNSEGCVVVDCEVINKSGFQTLMKNPKYFDPNFDSGNLKLMVFDSLTHEEFEKQDCQRDQTQRLTYLSKLFKNFSGKSVEMVDSRIANSWPEAEKIYEYWISKGLEGIIMKQVGGQYEFRRSDAWVKKKGDATDDFEVVGIEMGRDDKKWEGKCGSLLIKKQDAKGNDITVGVKSGLLDYDHENIQVVGDQILWTSPSGEMINIKGKLVEVKYDCVTEDGSLRFPRIVRRPQTLIRSDK